MAKSKASLKRRFLELLKEDEEFRLAVAGALGYDELLKSVSESLHELARLRQDMIEGFKRHDEELEKLRQDMMQGFKRHDEEFVRLWMEVAKLREDFNGGFSRLDRKLDALGACWGIMVESVFREGLRTLLKDLGLEVEKWSAYDAEGKVYGYASIVEIDMDPCCNRTMRSQAR